MVRIITDSAADFEPWEYEKLNIIHLPLFVCFADRDYQENVDLSKDEFYRLLVQSKEIPHTSQPSPHTVEQVLQEAMDAGDEAVVIPLASVLSGTFQSINMIRNLLNYESCYVVDSHTGTGGQRLLVEHAVKLRSQGKCAAEIAQAVEKLRERLVLYACMDTLENLMRGGRISRSAYTVASLANIKPIMHINREGRPEIPAKMIGMRRGMDHLCKIVSTREPDPQFPLYVMYTMDRRNGETLAKMLTERGYPISEDRIIPVGAAIGTHVAPNACGMVYIAKEE